jgi:hypothetical protein
MNDRILSLIECFREMDSLYSIGICLATNKFSIYFVVLIGVHSACCRYLDPLIQISNQNKHHLHSTGFLHSLLYGAQKKQYEHNGKIGISDTNYSSVGLVGETVQGTIACIPGQLHSKETSSGYF